MISGLKKNIDYKPHYVENVENMAEKHSLKLGVAGYWKAKQITMLNDEDLRVYAVFYPKLRPNLWTSRHKHWYYPKNENYSTPIFNFIVLDKDSDKEIFASIFGKNNIEFVKEKNASIVIVPDFYFDITTHSPIIVD